MDQRCPISRDATTSCKKDRYWGRVKPLLVLTFGFHSHSGLCQQLSLYFVLCRAEPSAMSVVSLNLDFSMELSLPPILSMAFVFPGALDILYSVCLTVGAEPSAASVAMTLSVVQFGRAFCFSVPFPICFSPFTGPGPSDGCVTFTYLSFFVFLLEQSLPPLCRWILYFFCFLGV